MCDVGADRSQAADIRSSETAAVNKGDHVVALAGNPNTGKSTLFNFLTGLRQHTGNWPGKTVARAEGSTTHAGRRFRVVDLPGTYSLLAGSIDEQIARDFLLFDSPDCTVVVCDATVLERNLHLALQIMQITPRVVVCANLIDEADRKQIAVQASVLERSLGVPVVPTAARRGQGLDRLMEKVAAVASGQMTPSPVPLTFDEGLEAAVCELTADLAATPLSPACRRWIAMRLLDADERIIQALCSGEIGNVSSAGGDSVDAGAPHVDASIAAVLEKANSMRARFGPDVHERISAALYARAAAIAGEAVRTSGRTNVDWDLFADRVLTNRWTGYPIMFLVLACVLWLTIAGANYPSGLIYDGLFIVHDKLDAWFNAAGAPWWLTGFLVHGVYRGLAWVVSVMLPPMAIFFPLFTLLEDVGYLPRVAFNLDRIFRWAGAHGKQALTMSMGLGCNAAGVIACRVIESPRERLLAIITNNFTLCNGRWPTIIMLAMVFVAARFPPAWATFSAAGCVAGVTLVGIAMTFLTCRVLSRTVLKGETSHFYLELPPYRRPAILRVIYRSIIDRTLFVLARACVVAAPAGGVIWLLGNIHVGGVSLMALLASRLDSLAWLMGMDGVILLAFIVAIPANEIVVPTIIMAYMATGEMTELGSLHETGALLRSHGWTLMTAACVMMFSLLHYPCATTTWTIYRETRSVKWTLASNLMPLALAFVICAALAAAWRLLAG